MAKQIRRTVIKLSCTMAAIAPPTRAIASPSRWPMNSEHLNWRAKLKYRVGSLLSVTCAMFAILFLLNGSTASGQDMCTICHSQFWGCTSDAWSKLLNCEKAHGDSTPIVVALQSCQTFVDNLNGSPNDEIEVAALRQCVDNAYTSVFGDAYHSICKTYWDLDMDLCEQNLRRCKLNPWDCLPEL